MEVSDTASKVIDEKQGGMDNDQEDARRGIGLGEGSKEASVEERKTDDKDELHKWKRKRKARRLRRGFGEGGELEELQRCRAQKQKVSWKKEGCLLKVCPKREGLIFG